MKEAKQSSSRNYPAASFYKEDIVSIIDVFKDVLNDCEIILDKYIIKGTDDIDTVKAKAIIEKVENLSIKYYCYFTNTKESRYLTLNIEKYNSRIYISDDSDNYVLGLMSKLDKIISSKKSVRRTLISPKVMLPGIIIITIISIIMSTTLPWKFSDHSVLSISLMVLSLLPTALLLIWAILGITTKRTNIIYLINSQDRSSFFKRNKDQIILALTFGLGGTIGAVIGSILTAIILNAIYPPKP